MDDAAPEGNPKALYVSASDEANFACHQSRKAWGQINIVKIANQVQNDNPHGNVALEDILSVALDMAQATGNAIVLEKIEAPHLSQ